MALDLPLVESSFKLFNKIPIFLLSASSTLCLPKHNIFHSSIGRGNGNSSQFHARTETRQIFMIRAWIDEMEASTIFFNEILHCFLLRGDSFHSSHLLGLYFSRLSIYEGAFHSTVGSWNESWATKQNVIITLNSLRLFFSRFPRKNVLYLCFSWAAGQAKSQSSTGEKIMRGKVPSIHVSNWLTMWWGAGIKLQ